MYTGIYLKDSVETLKVGELIGRVLSAGTCICLHGELGAGKTHMAKGIAIGLGVEEIVSSPTFTIVQEYRGNKLELLHFDVYRLSGGEELELIGFSEYLKRNGVVLIEWAEIVKDILPIDRIDIYLKYSDDGGRIMDIVVSDKNLVEAFESLRL
ncbi:MAG: tRNA (adenosine(37)-N6)-threonylcarbamoyltransferase complex ATPase subunit type 1 TsaE [Filifactoraceae bacterium]